MIIDLQNFTPWSSLAGGILLGIAAAIFILASGRILGISGILGGLLKPAKGDTHWRIAFLLGLFSAPFIYLLAVGSIPIEINTDWPLIILAGLLVGFGTRLGSGCSSGHGICGLSRLSGRSLVATIAFMASGIATVYVVRHLIG